MLRSFLKFNEQLQNDKVGIPTQKLNNIIKNYSFLHIIEEFDINKNQIIYQNFIESPVIIIYQYEEVNTSENNVYIILSFKNTILLINQSQLILLFSLFNKDTNIKICFLSDCQNAFRQQLEINFNEIKSDDTFQTEITTFIRKMIIPKKYSNLFSSKALKIIKSCIAAYLIKQSYFKLKSKPDFNFSTESRETENKEIFKETEFIELRSIGVGSIFYVKLMYHIEKEELFAMKQPFGSDIEHEKLLKREIKNYSSVNYPLLPKLYGTIENCNYLIIEFINGKTLEKIKDMHLNQNEKCTIIFQLLMIFNYLHKNGFVYRDLKPNNVMIDEQKRVYLIDFDRMIKISEIDENTICTADFASVFVSPDVNNGKISYDNDIYSLRAMIFYIDNVKYPDEEICQLLYKKKSTILELIDSYYLDFYMEINISIIPKDPDILNFLGLTENGLEDFDPEDIDKVIHYFSVAAEENHPKAQFYLGLLYYEDLYLTIDIDKAIHYFTLAADLNHAQAQYNLGLIYYKGQYIQRDIDKSIHYFTLASNQQISKAHFYLGLIYYDGKYAEIDINKAIHFFELASDQNYCLAQFYLGQIYYNGKYVKQNINKAIHYFSLASDQQNSRAQLYLGIIYSKCEFVKQDIKKAIHYFTLAAENDNPYAKFCLGYIYIKGEHVKQDIEKGIYYFLLAAMQNLPQAQYCLGVIYDEGVYVTRDTQNAFEFYSRAADQNFPQAQYELGVIYYDGQYVARDMNKVIHYFKLAADQNFPQAQYNLGVIYYQDQYVARDINKAIRYFQLAADQNFPQAQYNLGVIYYDGEYVTRDINKAIYYFQLAAYSNIHQAQFNLGFIYNEGRFVDKDIDKAIHYFSLAANKNHAEAQFNLGIIYYEGLHIAKDIDKAIHYFLLAGKQNHAGAQFYLGFIYYKGQYVTRDIDKAINYFTFASNHNISKAQFNLGVIYYEGQYIPRDINKAIYYYSLAAKQNDSQAQYNLGAIYLQGRYIARDINISIHYLSLAAKQNHSKAQYYLGIIYYFGLFLLKDVNKGQNYIIQSSKNGNNHANFAHGFLLHEGKYMKNNIEEAVHYYKEASSFDNQYAKNNLGILYKNGFGNEIKKRVWNAIEYFEEAIRQKNDILSMYNLAHVYMYDESIKQDINKSIELLIKSSNKFKHSLILLCLLLIKHFGNNLEIISNEVEKFSAGDKDLSYKIKSIIFSYNLLNLSDFNLLYESYETADFLYDISLRPVLASNLTNIEKDNAIHEYRIRKNISSLFYDGFGHDLL